MPEQKCCTIDGKQVLWKLYRKKSGDADVVKFCAGKVLPEKDWQSLKILPKGQLGAMNRGELKIPLKLASLVIAKIFRSQPQPILLHQESIRSWSLSRRRA